MISWMEVLLPESSKPVVVSGHVPVITEVMFRGGLIRFQIVCFL